MGELRTPAQPLPEALDPLLERIERERLTGVMTATGRTAQKRIVFKDGDVIFGGSDDPRDLIGQALIRNGLISEKDLTDALARSRKEAPDTDPGPRLASVLTAMRKVTPEQCTQVFESKIRESVLDIFLWPFGAVEFVEGGVANVPYPLLMKVDGLRKEGAKRRARWEQVQRVLPDPEIAFERAGDAWPEGFPATPGDKRLAQLVEQGLSLARMLVELRGQDYAVSVRLAQLVQSGVLRTVSSSGFVPVEIDVDVEALLAGTSGGVAEVPSGAFTKVGQLPSRANPAAKAFDTPVPAPPAAPGAPPPPPPSGAPPPPPGFVAQIAKPGAGWPAPPPAPAPPAPAPAAPAASAPPDDDDGAGRMPDTADPSLMLELAQARLDEGKLDEAQVLLMEAIAADPLAAADAWGLLQDVEQALTDRAREAGLTDDVTVALTRPVEQLLGANVHPSESFVFSRLAKGPATIGNLLAVCPFQPHELLQILQRRIQDGTLATR